MIENKLLKAVELKFNVSPKALSDKLGVSLSLYCNWRCGRTNLPIWRISQLLGLYNLEPQQVLRFIRDQYPPKVLEELTKGYATTGQQLKLGIIKR